MKTEIEKIQEEYKALGERIEALKNEKPKFKVGKYYKIFNTKSGCMIAEGRIGKLIERPEIKPLNYIGWFFEQKNTLLFQSIDDVIYCVNDDVELTPLSPQEVEQHLIAEAKRRYKKGNKVGDNIIGNENHPGVTDKSKLFFYQCDEVWAYGEPVNMRVFSNGKWAEIIEVKDQPILIGGKYEVKFGDELINVNGKTYCKKDLTEISRLFHYDAIKSINVGCDGQYKVDAKLINQILERLK